MMAFDIHDPATERLVRSLAERQGVSPEEAIKRAVANQLQSEDQALNPLTQIEGPQDRITVREEGRPSLREQTIGYPTSTAGDRSR